MGFDEMIRIKQFFEMFKLNPIYLEHEPAITSEDAAKTRGFELRQGIKALLFTDGKGRWAVVDIPADRRTDEKKVAEFLGWSKSRIRMASAEEVMEKTGCAVGAVPPFGHKEQIQILVDRKVYGNKESAFNIGLRTHSVKIPTGEMMLVFKEVGSIEGDFTK